MPAVVAAAVVAGVAQGIATGIIFAWGAFVTTLIVGGVNYLIAQENQPDPIRLDDPGRMSSVRQATQPRRIVYGQCRTGGVYAYQSNTGPKNILLHLIIMWAGHECEEISDILVNDKSYLDEAYNKVLYTDVTDINIQGAPDGRAVLTVEPAGGYNCSDIGGTEVCQPIYLGTETNFEDVQTWGWKIIEITGSASNDGIYYIEEGYDNLGPYKLYMQRIDDASAVVVNESAGAAVTIRERYVWCYNHLGAADQAADANLMAAVDDWTSEHRLRGICYTYVALAYTGWRWPGGLPNISAIIKGKKDIYDPRSGTSGWTANAALCVADYLIDSTRGLGVDYASGIDEDQLIAAANVCDEDVTLASGGTAPRYTCNGTFPADTAPEDAIPALSSAMAGYSVKTGGRWRVLPGAYDMPTTELTDDYLRGPIKVQPRVARDQLFNAVRGTIASAAATYVPTDFPPVRNSFYEAQDNDQVIWKDIELAFTDNTAEAQRIAKVNLEQMRQQIRVQFPANLRAMEVTAGTNVLLTNDRMGWNQKPFFVEGWDFSPYEDENGEQALGIDLSLRETAAGVFDWNSGEETAVDLAPDTTLVNPFDLAAVTLNEPQSGTDQLFVAGDGTVISRIKLTWSISESGYVDAYDVCYKISADDSFSYMRVTGLSAWIAPVQDLVAYDIGVRPVVSSVGAVGPWAFRRNYTVVGKSEPPGPVDTFTVLRQQDGTRQFQWTKAVEEPDLDGYKIRYRLGTSWTWDDMADLHEGLLQNSPYETNLLAAGTYVFAIKPRDRTGNYADAALYITASLGDPRGAENSIEFQDAYEEGWPGTKTNCVVDTGILRAADQATWDTLPSTWDAWTRWVFDPVGQFIYEHPEIDLGVSAAFVPLVSVNTESTPTVEVNYSVDGSTYSGWVAAAGQVQARYIKVRVTVDQAGSELPALSGMTINLSARPVEETIEDLDTSTLTGANRLGAGDIRLPIQETYVVIRSIQIALQSVGAGWTWDIVDKDVASGPRVRIFDSGGNPADAIIDATIKGL